MAFERIEPDTKEWAAYYGNHISRYMFAATKLQELGKRHVLDAACGVGYGAQHLAEAAGVSVVAVDRSSRALQIATGRFSHPRVIFCRDDCHTLAHCGGYAPFDAVVSFETVEHLSRPGEFLARCRAMLAPDGVLVASTPNRSATKHGRERDWEYHQREYTAADLLSLFCSAGFAGVTLYGQRLTALGRFRGEIRAELNVLRFNPVVRAGSWLQRVVRGWRFLPSALPEQVDDFEIVPFPSAEGCDALGEQGPFALVVLARP